MTTNNNNAVITEGALAPGSYQGNDKLLFGIVLAVVTFWLFAQTTLNIAFDMRADLGIGESWSNIKVIVVVPGKFLHQSWRHVAGTGAQYQW